MITHYDKIKNEHDRKKCEEALDIFYDDWDTLNEDDMETQEGKDALHYIKMSKYHQQELQCNCL